MAKNYDHHITKDDMPDITTAIIALASALIGALGGWATTTARARADIAAALAKAQVERENNAVQGFAVLAKALQERLIAVELALRDAEKRICDLERDNDALRSQLERLKNTTCPACAEARNAPTPS